VSPGMKAGSNPAPSRGWLLEPMRCSTAGSMVDDPVPDTAGPYIVIGRLHGATESHCPCIGLQPGGKANLVTAARSVAVSFRRSRTLRS
jgi:hypothetical protein